MTKRPLKFVAHLVAILFAAPFAASYFVARNVLPRDEAFASACEWLSLWPGISGSYVRVAFLRMTIKRCVQESRIGFGVLFSKADSEIGRHAYIGPRSSLGLVTLEDDVLIGPAVQVLSGAQIHASDQPDLPIREQALQPRRVTIGKGAWIGAGAIIMADVGAGSIVGAGSVVTRPVPPGVVVAGAPAKLLRNRSPIDCTAVNRTEIVPPAARPQSSYSAATASRLAST